MTITKIHVLQVISAFRTGGAERVVLDLLRYLERDRFIVRALCLYPPTGSSFEREAYALGIDIQFLNKGIASSLSCLRRANSILREWPPQVVHSHGYSLGAILPAAILNRTPVHVHTVHCSAGFEVMGWRRWLRHAAFRHLGVVPVAISSGVRRSIRDVYGEFNVPVIRNGIDTNLYKPDPEVRNRWRQSNQIDDSAIVIVSNGNLNPNKNQAMLLHAFQQVASVVPQAVLIIVGDGPSRSSLVDLTESYGLGERVRFLGERSDVYAILNAADIFALCSNSEGLGLSILEAMATRKPVVATRTDGATEILSQAESGKIVPIGDSNELAQTLMHLCQSADSRTHLGMNARTVVCREFDVRDMTRRYERLYSQLAAGGVVSSVASSDRTDNAERRSRFV
jgi:glycosyltransferase involved in cell wall biosynthesis